MCSRCGRRSCGETGEPAGNARRRVGPAGRGFRTNITVDRDAAMRLGVPMQAIEDTLYDSFGQRQISTIFGQANQYRVILEADPAWQAESGLFARCCACPRPMVTTCRCRCPPSRGSRRESAPRSAGHHAPGAVPVRHAELQSGAGAFARRRGRCRRPAEPASACPRRSPAAIPATPPSSAVARRRAVADPGRGGGDLHRAGRAVRKLDPSDHDPVHLPSAGIGALLALMMCGIDLSLVALVGVVLLMGIVKKNAIMMVDFALDAQRSDGARRAMRSSRPACCGSARS
jgi:multidrug efflux pump